MKGIAFSLVLLGTVLCAQAQEPPQTYSVVAIAENDTLIVRSRPSQSSSIVARLRNGTTGIQVVGQSVMNGNDDWIPVSVSGVKGWVRPKFLSSSPAGARVTTALEDLPAVDLSIPPDWRPHSREWTRVYGAAANGYIDEARRRLARGESGSLDDIRYGWADYLYQQQRIRFWTPIVIAAGITLADAMLKADPGPSRDESYTQHGRTPADVDYDRQKYQRRENEIATSREDPLPYPNAPH